MFDYYFRAEDPADLRAQLDGSVLRPEGAWVEVSEVVGGLIRRVRVELTPEVVDSAGEVVEPATYEPGAFLNARVRERRPELEALACFLGARSVETGQFAAGDVPDNPAAVFA